MMIRRAVLLAGGKGTRLKPYTISLPKPLVPINDKPILELLIMQLKSYGFNHITISVNHMADIIKAFFGNGNKWGIKIDYALESSPLSTMGPLTIIPDLPDNFLVMNGDVLTDLNFVNFHNLHISMHNNFTICANRRKEKIDYGVLEIDTHSKLVGFNEKPVFEFLVSMGVYMVNIDVVKQIPINEFFGFDHLMRLLLTKFQNPSVYEHNGYWLDIGRPDDYERALNEIDNLNYLNNEYCSNR